MMEESFVGAMPVLQFLRRFLGYRVTMDDLPQSYDFSGVNGTGGELGTYETIRDALNNSGICPGFKAVIVPDRVNHYGTRLQCALGMIAENVSQDAVFAYDNMDLWLMARKEGTEDVFSGKGDSSTEEDDDNSRAIRRQLISYAATVLSRQHRLHLFSVLIHDHYARFARWDRSGCLISEQFDFHEHPELLAYFFWCYSKLSPTERGFDPTVRPATEVERRLLRTAVVRYQKECKAQNRKNVTALRKLKDSDHLWPTYTVDVEFDGKFRGLVIAQPFWDSDSLWGRATRGYLAYDTVARKLVFMKDSWRIESTRILAEGAMYAKLKKCIVPFLPDILAAGDVRFNNKVHRTTTQRCANKLFPPEWQLPCSRLDTLIHYRIVQELAYPLVSAVSSKEVVQVIRDVVEALKVAYHSGKVLHCDISLGNIMISKSGRGCLNDWDCAMDLTLRGNKLSSRVGTWQFMSSYLLDDPSKRHEIHDDLESCFWVLLKISLHYFRHEGANFSLDMFNEYVASRNNIPATGGNQKAVFLWGSKLASATWNCIPLNDLLHDLSRIFKRYLKAFNAYTSPDDDSDEDFERAEKRFRQRYEDLEQVDIILDCFDRALASDQWPAGHDAIQDQFKLGSLEQADSSSYSAVTNSILTMAKNEDDHSYTIQTGKRTTAKANFGDTRSTKRLKIGG